MQKQIDHEERRSLLQDLPCELEELSDEEAEQIWGGGILLLKYGGRLGEAQDRNGSP